MSARVPREQTPIEARLSSHGFLDVCDWGGDYPTQVSGRIPPEGKWFYYREGDYDLGMEIYPAGRYPFALPGSNARGGWDPMAIGKEPPTEWSYGCPRTPHGLIDHAERTEFNVVRFVELWRRGEPSNDY